MPGLSHCSTSAFPRSELSSPLADASRTLPLPYSQSCALPSALSRTLPFLARFLRNQCACVDNTGPCMIVLEACSNFCSAAEMRCDANRLTAFEGGCWWKPLNACSALECGSGDNSRSTEKRGYWPLVVSQKPCTNRQ